ncbi:DUF1835 domain-containing protein [Paraburkholderia phymatum]|uniref:DUF1835 domain-containing protein n=1 Tax=Paraburkholderia phymatum (strain DSM 17167 / CIP 108236 / LMG 21445 / STM815) TaxID=391038 RepID=B2JII8_PARP8|nr:DUF1835 domain-containing protein [Paraburkholderia phymatum]ACC72034.1 Domain of unknown function DUF1835 [Paraburkholderia phymatum STM815]
MSTIHITNGDVAADSLRKALVQAGRREAVLALRDDLAVGPLQGIDDTPQVRADFWRQVSGDDARDFFGEFVAQAADLKAVVDGTAHVLVWHGQSAADQLTLRRVCFHLQDMPLRLNEVRLSIDDLTGEASAPLRRRDQATSVGMFAADLLLKHLPAAAPISALRIGRLALEWQEVKLANAELRRWRDDTFTSGMFAELDALLFEHAVDGWQSAGRVAAHLMAADNGLLVSDRLVLWRLRELAAAGQLQLRGQTQTWRSLETNFAPAARSPV